MGFYDKARGMGHYYAGMQHHPVNTIHDGDEKVGKLIDALPGDEQQSFRERLAAIPRTFSASAEQTAPSTQRC